MSAPAAVILAAGVGSRLRPLTDDRPKALVSVGGRSILRRALDALVERGVSLLVVATGYREDALKAALSDAPLDVTFVRNPEYERTQNSVSLALCRNALEGRSFYRLDGDVLFAPDVLSRLDAIRAPIVAAIDRGRLLDAEAMKAQLDASGTRVVEFGKHLELARSGGESIGVEWVSSEANTLLFDGLDRARDAGEVHLYYEDVYSRLIAAGLHVGAADVSGIPWCEVDSPEDLEQASRLFAR